MSMLIVYLPSDDDEKKMNENPTLLFFYLSSKNILNQLSNYHNPGVSFLTNPHSIYVYTKILR